MEAIEMGSGSEEAEEGEEDEEEEEEGSGGGAKSEVGTMVYLISIDW